MSGGSLELAGAFAVSAGLGRAMGMYRVSFWWPRYAMLPVCCTHQGLRQVLCLHVGDLWGCLAIPWMGSGAITPGFGASVLFSTY